MAVAKETTRCPFCKEVIMAGATICKHCQSELSSRPAKSSGPAARLKKRLDTFRTGFLVGILFSLVIVFLIYRHFS